MICKFCGKETSDTAKFCINCGAKVSGEETASEAVNETSDAVKQTETGNAGNFTEVQQTAQETSENVTGGTEENSSPILNGTSDYSNTNFQMPTENSGYESVPNPAVKKKKSSAGKIILIIAIVVIVFILIFAIVFAVVFKTLKGTYDSLGNTWKGIAEADSSKIVEELPDDYLKEVKNTYGFEESDVKEALDLMLADIASSQFTTDDVKVTKFKSNYIKKSEASSNMPDVINSVFEDSLADYEDQFPTVFAPTYAFIENSDKFYSVDETIKYSSDTTKDYETMLIKNDGEKYDVITLILTDICCYYYDVYQDYMQNEYAGGNDTEAETGSENETFDAE